ncbi:CBS domain-containing protein [Gammaproteobacteria bacterium AS21]
MKKLALHNLELVDEIISPDQFIEMTLLSPATDFFTDFKLHKALVIDADTLATDALKLMQKTHVQMEIVVSEKSKFLGVISTRELTERHIMQKVFNGAVREEITVGDMMIHRNDLHAFSYTDIKKSNINDVINTLKNYGLRHCLVIDKENHHIRGVISASDIARKLQLPVEINTATSFSRIFEKVQAAM